MGYGLWLRNTRRIYDGLAGFGWVGDDHWAGLVAMNLRHPLANAKGSGASGEGSHHWWLQRLTAVALIPLSLWFMFAVVSHIGDDYQTITTWVSHPGVAVFLILYLVFMFWHGQLGVQVIIEDYVHHEGTKLFLMLLIKAVLLLAGAASVFAILKLAL